MESFNEPPSSPSASGPESVIAHWDRTFAAGERFSNRAAFFEEEGSEASPGQELFAGRPIIRRDTPINGGVYLSLDGKKATVVDDQKHPLLQDVYKDVRNNVSINSKGLALRGVFETTRSVLPYDDEAVNTISKQYPDGDKVSLSVFVRANAGSSAHQALLAGYLLEKLKTDSYLEGTVSIDRNTVPGRGGHAWVRYTSSSGRVYIIDPAQDFMGKLSEIDPDLQGFYKRPEEK